jgi:hypothetical protein
MNYKKQIKKIRRDLEEYVEEIFDKFAEQDEKIERIEDNQKSFDSSLQKFSVAFYKGTPLEKMAWEDITEKPIGEPQQTKPKFEGKYCSRGCPFLDGVNFCSKYKTYPFQEFGHKLNRCLQCLDEYGMLDYSKGDYGIKLNYEDKSSDNLRAKVVSQLDKLIGQYDIDSSEVEYAHPYNPVIEIPIIEIPTLVIKFKEKKQNKTEIHNPRYDNRI